MRCSIIVVFMLVAGVAVMPARGGQDTHGVDNLRDVHFDTRSTFEEARNWLYQSEKYAKDGKNRYAEHYLKKGKSLLSEKVRELEQSAESAEPGLKRTILYLRLSEGYKLQGKNDAAEAAFDKHRVGLQRLTHDSAQRLRQYLADDPDDAKLRAMEKQIAARYRKYERTEVVTHWRMMLEVILSVRLNAYLEAAGIAVPDTADAADTDALLNRMNEIGAAVEAFEALVKFTAARRDGASLAILP